jgi:hypothetical protein
MARLSLDTPRAAGCRAARCGPCATFQEQEKSSEKVFMVFESEAFLSLSSTASPRADSSIEADPRLLLPASPASAGQSR